MGKMALQFGLAFLLLAEVVAIVSIFMPFHSMSVFAWAAKVARIKTYMMYVDVDFSSSRGGGDFCWLLGHVKKSKVCHKYRPSWYLNDFRERVCSHAVQQVIPEVCPAIGNAFILGVVFVIVISLDVILVAAAAYLTYHYGLVHKKIYRKIALGLVVISMAALLLVSIFYYGFVLRYLDLAFVPHSSGNGTQAGYLIMWVAIVLKIVACILYKYGKTKDEIRLRQWQDEQEVLNEQNEFAADVAQADIELGYRVQGRTLAPTNSGCDVPFGMSAWPASNADHRFQNSFYRGQGSGLIASPSGSNSPWSFPNQTNMATPQGSVSAFGQHVGNAPHQSSFGHGQGSSFMHGQCDDQSGFPPASQFRQPQQTMGHEQHFWRG